MSRHYKKAINRYLMIKRRLKHCLFRKFISPFLEPGTKVDMILRRAVYVVVCLLGLLGANRAASAVAADTEITFLYVGEAVPPSAVKLAKRSFTGNDAAKDCAYFELLQKTKKVAIELGANLVKIDSRRERAKAQYCDELNVSFYNLADLRRWEKHFSWSKARKLVWDDFKGPVPGNAPQRIAAVTSCSIAIETNTVTSDNPPKIYLYNTFETGTSWVKLEHTTASILQHEQTHFDICELYTRKMRERFSKANINVRNLQQVVRSIYQSTHGEYVARQQRYEEETQHGIIDDAQARWTRMIDEELSKTEAWMSI
jgi:hypothetical protein